MTSSFAGRPLFGAGGQGRPCWRVTCSTSIWIRSDLQQRRHVPLSAHAGECCVCKQPQHGPCPAGPRDTVLESAGVPELERRLRVNRQTQDGLQEGIKLSIGVRPQMKLGQHRCAQECGGRRCPLDRCGHPDHKRQAVAVLRRVRSNRAGCSRFAQVVRWQQQDIRRPG